MNKNNVAAKKKKKSRFKNQVKNIRNIYIIVIHGVELFINKLGQREIIS